MPIAGVGVKPDGTLGWVDAQGLEVNPDGTPVQGAQQLKPLNPAQNTAPPSVGIGVGGVGVGLPQGSVQQPPLQQGQTQAQTNNDVRDALVKSMVTKYGAQQGGASPVTTTVKIPTGAKLANGSDDPNAGKTLQQNTGYDLYTFNDGTSIELTPDGTSRNLKIGTGTGKTGSDIMAAAGQILAPNGQVYVKNTDTSPGAPPYILDTNSGNNQQLANAKTVADTSYQSALAKKTQIENDIASATDPATKAKLVDDKAQADIDYQKALTTKSAADIEYQKGMLGVSQTNAASTASNAASTAARVGAQNTLDTSQAGAVTQNAASTAARVGSQNALDIASAANQTASATAALKKANEPNVWTPNTTAPTTTYYDPNTGQIVTNQNQNYLPTDPGRMTAQLKQQADAQWQAMQQQVQAGKLTADQAASQFNKYWDESIEPVKGDIAAAQAKAQSAIDLQTAQANQYNAAAANYPATLAQTGSSDAQKNLISMLPYVVGAGAATNPGITTGAKGFPQINAGQIMQNATYSLPNLQEVGRQGAAAALANFSPTAQMHLNTPGPAAQPQMPGGPDLNSMLNMNNYTGGPPMAQGGAPMQQGGPPGQPVAAPPPPAQGPPQPFDWVGTMARLNQDRADQSQQARFQMQPPAPGMFNPYYQQQYPGMGAGMAATGPIAGGLTGTSVPWGWPPYQPST